VVHLSATQLAMLLDGLDWSRVSPKPVRQNGRPLLGPVRKGRETEEFLRNAHTDIPAVVEAMRQYWMPTRYARAG
jgi:hypothetical protein